MIDTKSIAAFHYMNSILEKGDTLEQAFSKLLMWTKETTQNAVYLRERRNIKIEDLKTNDSTMKSAMDEL